MRMWMLPVHFMCQQHRLGEHAEIHKHRHVFEKGQSIQGRVSPIVQIEPLNMRLRHNLLMLTFKTHKFDYTMPDLSAYPDSQINVEVDIEYNLNDLYNRCSKCRKIMDSYGYDFETLITHATRIYNNIYKRR